MKLAKAIAYRIRTLREAAGLSQQEVAVKGDLSLSLVAKLEQGKKADPRASTLLALSGALGVRPGELLENLAPPPAPPAPAEEAVTESGEPLPEAMPAKKKGKGKKGKKAKSKKPATV
jgi:transcriptional regulator with XRE-family HTH domain